MAGQKRLSASIENKEFESSSNKKRRVSVSTFEKWQGQFDKDHSTLTWLRCDKDSKDRAIVATVWCDVCRKFEESIRGMKNFSNVWIEGSSNHKTSNITDHASSEQHKTAMSRLRIHQAKARNEKITTYSAIAKSLLTISDSEKAALRKKFDICFVMAKEGIPFAKYPVLFDLEARHGCGLGISYKNAGSARSFTYYIAESQRQSFINLFSSVPYFSFLLDGSTDEGNIEQEVVVLQYCSRNDNSSEITSICRYFSIQSPGKADADGLIQCLGDALRAIGIHNLLERDSVVEGEQKPILIGGCTDGAAVNIAQQRGMRGKLQEVLPWLFWGWCYTHRLELACKDSLSSPIFREVEEMLLRLYYIYHKSPKKSHELLVIASELKEIFSLPDGGSIPIRSQGSRWITHKRKALQRFVDRFGVYIAHLTSLSEDSTVKGDDRAKLKGYVKKWVQSKYLIASAMYIDILKAPSILSLSLQEGSLDIVQALHCILKSVKALKSLAKGDPREWPTVKLVIDRIKEENGSSTYQNVPLKSYSESSFEQCKTIALDGVSQLDDNMRCRLEWSDPKLLRCLIVFLDTQCWLKGATSSLISDDEDDDDMEEIKSAVEYISSIFSVPLEARGASTLIIMEEIEDTVQYARKYLNVVNTEYKKVWYKLHTCPNARNWPHVILLSQLLFSLPFSNARVEQIFSALKVVKTARRTKLQTGTLNDLLEIYIEGPQLSEFSADHAIELWWKSCNTSRRVNQHERKEYTASSGSTSSETLATEADKEEFSLNDWDDWFMDAQ